MQMITTIGLDIAKSVFQVHGVRRPPPETRRKPPCHEPHGCPGDGLADRLGICRIVLLTFDVGLHVGWRHQAHANKDARAAELPDASPHTPSVHTPADRGD
jgi:hypothetical protein